MHRIQSPQLHDINNLTQETNRLIKFMVELPKLQVIYALPRMRFRFDALENRD